MRCNKAKDFLNRELDEQLPPVATGDLREHLDACAECREYHDDLLMGRRLLAATEPTLPENFDWKLQLRLNQALRQRAGETAYPWDETATDRWHWLRNFSASAAVGLAAVLTVAMVLGPVPIYREQPVPTTQQLDGTARTAGSLDRGSLTPENRISGLYDRGVQRPVATGGSRWSDGTRTRSLDLGWSGDRIEDLRTIQRLRAANQQLNRRAIFYQREVQRLRAQLDTTGVHVIDLDQEN